MEAIATFLPPDIGPAAAAMLVAASFFTSALTAGFGVGGGVAMLALLGLFLPVSALIPVHGAVQLGSNTGRAWHQRAFIRTDIMKPFAIGCLVGAVLGALLVVQLPDAPLKVVLGVFIIAISWARIPGFDRLGQAGLSLAAVLLAFLTMFFGATGPLMSPVMAQFIPNDRKALIATHAAAMVLQHGLKVIVFGLLGFAFLAWLPLVAAMIFTGYIGTILGSRLLERIPEESFRFWFKILLTVLAADMIRRGLADWA